MASDVNETLAAREKTYGSFSNVAAISQEMKDVVYRKGAGALPPAHKEALDMIFSKIARITCGKHSYIESWRDIGGYAQLIVDVLMQEDGATDARVMPLVREAGSWRDAG